MNIENVQLREALQRIEVKAASALANQPHDEVECASGLKKAIQEIGEIAGVVGTCVVAAALLWAFCEITPPQMSGEYDIAAEATAAYLAEGGAE